MTSNSLVSIIIPCYNVENYVEKAINSILNQSYTNLEIWLIDDASTDGTLQKLSKIKDDRIQIISFKENTKKVGAVNEVLQKVKGDFITFQDADDWSEPDRIHEQVKQFVQNTALGICFTNYRTVGLNTFLPGKVALTNEELKDGFLEFGKQKSMDLSLPLCASMMISKEALKQTRGYHPYFAGRIAEDIHWVYRILKKFDGITVDKVLYNYFKRAGSLTEIQSTGKEAKYAYSFQLLSKIIHKDIHEDIDVLAPVNKDLLVNIELEACEEALAESVRLLNKTRDIYEDSMSFRIGKFMLTPWRIVKNLKG